jgi:hypothetical protein
MGKGKGRRGGRGWRRVTDRGSAAGLVAGAENIPSWKYSLQRQRVARTLRRAPEPSRLGGMRRRHSITHSTATQGWVAMRDPDLPDQVH